MVPERIDEVALQVGSRDRPGMHARASAWLATIRARAVCRELEGLGAALHGRARAGHPDRRDVCRSDGERVVLSPPAAVPRAETVTQAGGTAGLPSRALSDRPGNDAAGTDDRFCTWCAVPRAETVTRAGGRAGPSRAGTPIARRAPPRSRWVIPFCTVRSRKIRDPGPCV